MTAPQSSPSDQDPDHLNAAAVQALNGGRLDIAEVLLKRALALAPGLLQLHGNLGNVASGRQDWTASFTRYRRGLALDVRNPVLHLMLGTARLRSGDVPGGMQALRSAIDLRPDYAAAHTNLGNAFIASLDPAGAEPHFRKAIGLDPGMATPRVGLARVLRDRWQITEAAMQTRVAIVLDPRGIAGFLELSNAERAGGDLSSSLVAARRALACGPDDPTAISTYLFGLHFDPASSSDDIARAHRVLGARIAGREAGGRRRPTTGRPLRVGMVSADFRKTPASWFLLPVLAGRAPAAWQAICYSDVGTPDATTARFQECADLWRSVAGWTDARLAAAIAEDRIDVLFDLAGHTAGSRLPLFARRAAPVQATWLGYNDTTGIPAMDFILADRVVVPEEDDHLYTERVVRLRDGFLCYGPPDYAPAVAPTPAVARGHFTFGCFGQLTKITDDVLGRWKRILAAAPDARLVVMAPGLGEAGLRATVLARMMRNGLPKERVELRPQLDHRQFLESYANIDLMLDTHPYGAGTTACEALWMGVPIVTLPSDRLLGRQSASHLRNVGLPEFIANDADDYVEKASAWSKRPQRLAQLRGELRERMRSSPLVDQARFADSFAAALEEMCRRAGQATIGSPSARSVGR